MKLQIGLVTLLLACSGGENVIEKQDNSAPQLGGGLLPVSKS